GTVSWSLGDLGLTSATVHLVVHVDPARLANLSNTASARSNTTDPNPGDDSATETTTVATAADLHISKSDSPDPVTAGNNLTYTLTVSNNGPSFARNVSFSNAVPAGTSFALSLHDALPISGTVSWSLGDLGLTSATVHLVVHVDPARLANL